MLSRSPKRSLVMNWWCVGTMPVCRLDAVSASSCSRFSRRCSSKIFCQETRLNCLSPPDMGLLYFFIYVTHSLPCIIYDFLIQNTALLTKALSVRCILSEFEIHLFVPMAPPQHFILALPVSWGRVWNRNRKRITLSGILTVNLKANPVQ